MKKNKLSDELKQEFQNFKVFLRYYKKTILKKRIEKQHIITKYIMSIIIICLAIILGAEVLAEKNYLNFNLNHEKISYHKNENNIELKSELEDFISDVNSNIKLESVEQNLCFADLLGKKASYIEIQFNNSSNDYYELIYIDQELYEKLIDNIMYDEGMGVLSNYKKMLSYLKIYDINEYNYFIEHTTFKRVKKDKIIDIEYYNMQLIGCFDIIDCEILTDLTTGIIHNIKTKYYHNVDIDNLGQKSMLNDVVGKTLIYELNVTDNIDESIKSLNELLLITNNKYGYYEVINNNNQKQLIINYPLKSELKQFDIYKDIIEKSIVFYEKYKYNHVESCRVVMDYTKLLLV